MAASVASYSTALPIACGDGPNANERGIFFPGPFHRVGPLAENSIRGHCRQMLCKPRDLTSRRLPHLTWPVVTSKYKVLDLIWTGRRPVGSFVPRRDTSFL